MCEFGGGSANLWMGSNGWVDDGWVGGSAVGGMWGVDGCWQREWAVSCGGGCLFFLFCIFIYYWFFNVILIFVYIILMYKIKE